MPLEIEVEAFHLLRIKRARADTPEYTDLVPCLINRPISVQWFRDMECRAMSMVIGNHHRLHFRRETVECRNSLRVSQLQYFETILAVSEVSNQRGVRRSNFDII